MSIEQEWLKEFRRIVDAEISAANGKPADGYRAMAAKTEIGYDYIYQIYKGKPKDKPKTPGKKMMETLAKVYGPNGRGAETMAIPCSDNSGSYRVADQPQHTYHADCTLATALQVVAEAIMGLESTPRRRVGMLLADLADDPTAHASLAELLQSVIDSSKRKAA